MNCEYKILVIFIILCIVVAIHEAVTKAGGLYE